MSPSWSEGGGRLAIVICLLLASPAARCATVVMPAAATGDEALAAAELGRAWLLGTGLAADVRREHAPPRPGAGGPFFFVGETALARAQAPLPAGLDPDGFRVRTLPGGRVVIRGATGFATVLAADWYAQHGMGLRWYMPGPSGEVAPSLQGWSPPALDRVVEPAFRSRELTGLDPAGAA